MLAIFTIGHSNHSIEKFLTLLNDHSITAIADVRSRPFSRRYPHFSQGRLAAALAEHGIAYVFLGAELGARTEDESCYEAGKVQYARLAATALFKQGIDRVLTGAEKFRVALMCAEKEPLDCHRMLLVSRALERHGIRVEHILADGSVETQASTLTRLIGLVGLAEHDLFTDPEASIEEACRRRESKIAYVRPQSIMASHR